MVVPSLLTGDSMIFFYGTYPITFTGDQGTFHCPRCGPGKRFSIKNWTRFAHIYWIPLIPCGWGSVLECESCSGTWDEKVRHYDPEAEKQAFEAKFETAMMQAMVAMAEADGHVAENELQAIAGIMTRLTPTQYSVADVRSSLRADGSRTLRNVLRAIADDLNDSGKEMVIRSLCWVADADDGVGKEEKTRIFEAAKILAIKRERVEAILAEVEKS
jgi:uncharacterized tellurite resistance protein B-like protein